jgi:hypothetical protein
MGGYVEVDIRESRLRCGLYLALWQGLAKKVINLWFP